MAPKVNEQDVDKVKDFTAVSRKDAENAIRTTDYNVERAIEYIISGDYERDKQERSKPGKTFMNTISRYYTRSKSPKASRKASPSIATNEIINVSEEDFDEEQLRLAVEMSLQGASSSNVPSRRGSPNLPSETASLQEKAPYFGPARRSEYQEGSWGMVVSEKGKQETGIVVDDQETVWPTNDSSIDDGVPAEDRKRVDGQPIVLDTRSGGASWTTEPTSALAGLMTILHQIPKVREAFLLAAPRDEEKEEFPPEGWWNGNGPLPIAPELEGVDTTGEAVLLEAARIMAFLDDTDRSYGKLAEYLNNALRSDIWKAKQRGDSTQEEVSASTFLHRWTYIVESNFQRTYLTTPLSSFFRASIYQPPGEGSLELRETLTEIQTWVSKNLSDPGVSTILDALEETFWSTAGSACITEFSDVLLINLKREDREGGAGVEILPKMSLARFASDNYEQAQTELRMRKGIHETLDRLRKREDSLTWIRAGKIYRATDVLQATIQYLSGVEGTKLVDVDDDDDGDAGGRMDIDSESTLPSISALLKTSVETLGEKVQETQNTIKNMEHKLMTMFHFPDSITRTRPAEGDNPATSVRISTVYLLRGVIVDQIITFFSQWEHFSNPYKKKLIWFKSEFTSGKPDVVVVDEGEVLTIARDRGSEGVITVYVREDLPETAEKVLPPMYLREFIQKDNELFQKELNPPVIQVTQVDSDSVTTNILEQEVEATQSRLRSSSRGSRNPFLSVQHVDEEQGPIDENMVVEGVSVGEETNPFRRRSGEPERTEVNVVEDEEMNG